MILVSVFNSLSIHWTYEHDFGISIGPLYLSTGHMNMILVSVFNSLSIHWTYEHDIGISIGLSIYPLDI